jgi:hypothetical protein
MPGHSQNSGACLPDESEQYAGRLATANSEIAGDLAAIAANARDAIVILAADHGPFLTGDCLHMSGFPADDLTATHLADRYGALLAVRWPDSPPVGVDRISAVQNVFFAVIAYLLEDERVWRERLPIRTKGYGGIPDDAVVDGIVRVGRDRGRPLLQ